MIGKTNVPLGMSNGELLTVNVSGISSGFEITVREAEIIDGYAVVEYIESTGTQYIDTGVKANAGVRYQVRCMNTDTSVTTNIIGANASGSRVYIHYSSARGIMVGYGSYTNVGVTMDTASVYDIDASLAVGSQTVSVNGTQVYSASDTSEINTDLNSFLCALNVNGGASYYFKGRIYSCQIYMNDILVRDFVPVKSTGGIYGLYDRRYGKFYRSIGESDFVGRSIVGEVIGTSTLVSSTFFIPTGTGYMVSTTEVSGYVTPSVQYFTAETGSRVVDVVYGEVLNGVYILDTDGRYWISSEWDGSNGADCIAVVSDTCRFGMALEDAHVDECAWGGYGVAIDGIVTTTNESEAKIDYDGKGNTEKIISQLRGTTDSEGVVGAPAAEYCAAYVFPSGAEGYLPSLGELWTVEINFDAINETLEACGLEAIYADFWSSTQYNSRYSWFYWLSGAVVPGYGEKTANLTARAFRSL